MTLAESAPRSDRSGRHRWVAAGSAVAVHLAILALFLGSHPPATMGEGVGAGAMDIELAGFSKGSAPSPAHAAAKPRASPSKPAPPTASDPIKPRTVLQVVSDILAIPLPEHSVTPQPLVSSPTPTVIQAATPASGSPGAACDIGGAVQVALRSDPAAHQAVTLIPRPDRSAANAVMMWNGQWIDPAEVGGAASFSTVRTSIRQIVAAADPGCRDQELVGPRFMLIPDAEGAMIVVAVGNATWRWSDLLIDPPGAADDL